MKVAIYHYTNKSSRRPKIYKDQLKTLEEFAISVDLEITDFYGDFEYVKAGYLDESNFRITGKRGNRDGKVS